MITRTISLARHGATAVIALDRPQRANTLNVALLLELQTTLQRLQSDDQVRVVVLTGAGRHFCGGWDLTETTAVPDGAGFNTSLGAVSKPLIAAVNGAAMGGGCEIALACDFRLASDDATLALPEIRFGELPAGGGTARLAGVVGTSIAKRLIMTGEALTAEQARQVGLVDSTYPAAELMSQVLQFAGRLAERAPYAVRAAKQLIDRSVETDLATALVHEQHVTAAMATPQQRADARAHAAQSSGTYSRIFGATA